jgi:hypothetical protein
MFLILAKFCKSCPVSLCVLRVLCGERVVVTTQSECGWLQEPLRQRHVPGSPLTLAVRSCLRRVTLLTNHVWRFLEREGASNPKKPDRINKMNGTEDLLSDFQKSILFILFILSRPRSN